MHAVREFQRAFSRYLGRIPDTKPARVTDRLLCPAIRTSHLVGSCKRKSASILWRRTLAHYPPESYFGERA
jgi:hypothetical protein